MFYGRCWFDFCGTGFDVLFCWRLGGVLFVLLIFGWCLDVGLDFVNSVGLLNLLIEYVWRFLICG